MKYFVYSIHKVKKIGCTREDQWDLRLASHLRRYKNSFLPEDMAVMKIFDNMEEAGQYELDMQIKYGYEVDTHAYTHVINNMIPKSKTKEAIQKQAKSLSKTAKERGDWNKRLITPEAIKKAVASRDSKAIGQHLMKTSPLKKPLKAWKDGMFVGKFEGVGDASRKLSIQGVIISNVANPNQRVQSWKGWEFKYINN